MSIALIVGADDETAARMSAAIGHQAVALSVESVSSTSASLLRGLDPVTLPEAIVFSSALPVARSLSMAAEVHAVRPDIDMVLIAAVEKETMLDAMRVGIRDLGASLDDPSVLAGLRDRLDARADAGRAAATSPVAAAAPTEFTSRTITVLSPKGGVGKTSISSNLAVALAREAPMETVLVDLDLQFGDLTTVLDLKPTYTLKDAFGLGARDNLLLKTYLTVHSAGFYVLCGADSPAANDKVTGEQVAQLIRQLQDQFRYVVIDTAAGLDDATLAALECTDDAVIVTTMDVACLRSVQREMQLLTELGLLPASQHVVVNFADKASGLRIKDVEAVLGAPVDVVLPRSKDIPIASNRGVPVLVSSKSGPFVKSIKVLGKRIFTGARVAESRRGHKRLEVV
ncbi:AAA family ATPase [Aeromicrobium chenweiae]|uniref:Pilus assembly protein CpaE n=1 Tax=Aeromicrobium chenweiae TaxID=2079793 RepID=A0A2S0WJ62_9ACTN|nr:P-loop NTPase [Aeromicrobium chenweiae]AWB91381.1 pilus assembly protein CpaE [Aeromicrobium chenweiae]TGN30688.1 MinD/ParA family protein [Aeromicrobium chenweiae]